MTHIAQQQVYCVKHVSGRLEAYSRDYCYLGELSSEEFCQLRRERSEIESWLGWTGGRSNEPGNASWYAMPAAGWWSLAGIRHLEQCAASADLIPAGAGS